VWGKPVCARCAGSIIQAGIKRVVALNPDGVAPDSKWYKTGKFAQEMFQEAGVEMDFYAVEKGDA
jgi:dCMP deaminase